jgi:predicted DNA-binding transcriptional regulator AlpA
MSEIKLIAKADVLAITGKSYKTIWTWMQAGKFPRSRVVGGRVMWLSGEIDAWLNALPVQRLKGDAPAKPQLRMDGKL